MLSGKRIILGVSGGIAAYKAVFLLREFQKAGAEVRVIMTPSATRFVGLETFASLSGHEVAVEIFPEESQSTDWTRHINWGEWADLFVIAPCTANTLAKIANGISDNMLTSTVLAARSSILICPTMDGEMYDSPSVTENLTKVQQFGYHVLEPESGFLASGLDGKGRLPEFDTILAKADDAQRLGAKVKLIHGPVSIPLPEGIYAEGIVSAQDLFIATQKHADADIIIMAAAVSDFTPSTTHLHKVKKEDGEQSISLSKTQDILAWLGENRTPNQTLIGFAMETQDLVDNATKKLASKNVDWIVANSLSDAGAGFSVDTNHVQLLGREQSSSFSGTKQEVAELVLAQIFSSSPK